MERLRALLAHGGIALLAVVFALAFAAFNLASALAREVVSALQQHTIDSEGHGGLSFTVAHTTISYDTVLWYAITLALVAGALLGLWLLTRSTTRVCPECGSQVPRSASICRFCTSELEPDIADA
jgi:large conductance mechanosensitive channel